MFEIKSYHRQGRLSISCAGSWSIEEAKSFNAGISKAFGGVWQSDTIDVFADLSRHNVQSVSVVNANAEAFDILKSGTTGKHAIVTSSPLHTMQVRRIFLETNCRIFKSLAEAGEWLGWMPMQMARPSQRSSSEI